MLRHTVARQRQSQLNFQAVSNTYSKFSNSSLTIFQYLFNYLKYNKILSPSKMQFMYFRLFSNKSRDYVVLANTDRVS